MAEYSLDFEDVLALELKRFWFLSNMIDRLRAEKDLRQIQLLASVGSSEAYTAAIDLLQAQKGQIYVWEETPGTIVFDPNTLDPEFDRAGLQALKAKHA